MHWKAHLFRHYRLFQTISHRCSHTPNVFIYPQIIMCCIYAVCKVRDCELKFKEIVNMYRGLPHAASQVGCHEIYHSNLCYYTDMWTGENPRIITRTLGPWKLPCYIRFIHYIRVPLKKLENYVIYKNELGPAKSPCYKRVLLYLTSL